MVPDIAVQDAYKALQADPTARLVDVRTIDEWTQIGVPDTSATGHPPVFAHWLIAPLMVINVNFVAELEQAGLNKTDSLYFICRSGARSAAAAKMAQRAGYLHVANVAEGFEGKLVGPPGWAGQGLPVTEYHPG